MLDKLKSQYEALLPLLEEMGISEKEIVTVSFSNKIVDGLNIELNYPYFEICSYDKDGKTITLSTIYFEEIFFETIKKVTIKYCWNWELENRIQTQDTRILTFSKHIELLEKLNLNQKSINALKKEYNQLLDQELFSIK